MRGVIEVTFDVPIGRVIEDLLPILDCSLEGDWKGRFTIFLFRLVGFD